MTTERDLLLIKKYLTLVHQFVMRNFQDIPRFASKNESLLHCSFAADFYVEDGVDLQMKVITCNHCKTRRQLLEPNWREALQYLEDINRINLN